MTFFNNKNQNGMLIGKENWTQGDIIEDLKSFAEMKNNEFDRKSALITSTAAKIKRL